MTRPDREIHDLDDLDDLLASGAALTGTRLQDLDLTGRAAALRRRDDLHGVVVLGGTVPPVLARHLVAHGALVFPSDPHTPVDVYRAHLYDPAELYAGLAEDGYAATPDARAYAWSQDEAVRHDVFTTLLRAIHDDSVSDALTEYLGGRDVVGVMGGHAVQRGTTAYAQTAALGQRLAATGRVVLTGGGPGAMEAANLGALAPDDDALETALTRLAVVPSFRPDIAAWAGLALDVRAGLGLRDGRPPRSVGIPTWFYGHEPPNVFCDGVAKYFSNAVREDGLLSRCTAGIVVMPGAAGTAQEIFQAVTPLYYAATGAVLPRLVLVGRTHWTTDVPLWPAVQALAAGRAMAASVHLVDDVTAASSLLA